MVRRGAFGCFVPSSKRRREVQLEAEISSVQAQKLIAGQEESALIDVGEALGEFGDDGPGDDELLLDAESEAQSFVALEHGALELAAIRQMTEEAFVVESHPVRERGKVEEGIDGRKREREHRANHGPLEVQELVEDEPDASDSSSPSSSSSSSEDGDHGLPTIDDNCSLLALLDHGVDCAVTTPEKEAAIDTNAESQKVQSTPTGAAARMERRLLLDLDALPTGHPRTKRWKQLVKWLWQRFNASALQMSHAEVEALISRLAPEPGEPDVALFEGAVAMPATPPRKIAPTRRVTFKPLHRKSPAPQSILSSAGGGKRTAFFYIEFKPQKKLVDVVEIPSFLGVDLWHGNPGSSVICDWCGISGPKEYGQLQGDGAATQFAKFEFVCFSCLQGYEWPQAEAGFAGDRCWDDAPEYEGEGESWET